MGTTRPIPLYQRRNHLQHYKMMKLVVLALALSAAYAGTVYTGLPLGYPGAYTGVPTLDCLSDMLVPILVCLSSPRPPSPTLPLTPPPSSLPPHTGFTPVSRLRSRLSPLSSTATSSSTKMSHHHLHVVKY